MAVIKRTIQINPTDDSFNLLDTNGVLFYQGSTSNVRALYTVNGEFTLENAYTGDVLITAVPYGQIYDGSTSLPFASLAALQSYMTTNFFSSASGDTGVFKKNLVNNSIMIPFGDSHAAYQIDTGNPYYDSWGYVTQFDLYSGGKLFEPINLGVAGNTTVQMIARLGALLAYKPALVLLNGGGNDIAVSGSPAATIETNILYIVNAIQAIGANIILQTIPPRFSPNAFTAPQEVIRQAVNAYILSLVSPTLRVINWDTYVPTVGFYQSDGIHLTSQGAALVGLPNALAAQAWLNSPNIASQLTADNTLTTNLALTGTGGSLNTATGVAATSWTLFNNNGHGTTVVGSKGAIGGLNQQIITISGTTTGTNTRAYTGFSSSFAITSLNPGDITESIIDFGLSGTLNNIAGISIGTTYNGGSGYISDSESYFPIDGLASLLTAGRYQYRGYPFIVPAGVTSINLAVEIYYADGTTVPVSAIVTIYTAGIRKVDPILYQSLRGGTAILAAGTKAISIPGLTTTSRAFTQRTISGNTTLTTGYNAVCTTNTLTITADLAAGTINTADTSTLNYLIFD